MYDIGTNADYINTGQHFKIPLRTFLSLNNNNNSEVNNEESDFNNDKQQLK